MAQCTLKRCEIIYAKLQRDLVALSLPAESRKSLEIVTHSLGEIANVYRNLGPTSDTFVEMMRKIKEIVMGLDKLEDVKQKVTKEVAKSMFNYKSQKEKCRRYSISSTQT